MSARTPRAPRAAAVDALLGCAVGDCLGLPFENQVPPPLTWAGDAHRRPGLAWSDDTQQSLVLLDEALRHGRLEPRRVMDRFVILRHVPGGRFGLHRGTGRGFRHAVTRYIETGAFEPMPDRAGNGAAMRVTAAALALGESDDTRAQLRAVSQATHAPTSALDAAHAVAEAAWILARGGSGLEAVGEVAERLPEGEVRQALRATIRAEPADALAALEDHTKRRAGDGHALSSPLAAIVLAATSSSLHQALVAAIRLGGDTDSTAAIAGALRAGADGLGGLPPPLLEVRGLERLRRWGAPVLPTIDEWFELERELSSR